MAKGNTGLRIEGVSQDGLEKCLVKIEELERWVKSDGIDRWAFRAALIKALYDDADAYFASGEGTFRVIAAFDNGVASSLKNDKDEKS